MKLNRPPGDVPELIRPGGLTRRRGRCPSLLGICLLAAVIGGPASVAGAAGPNTQVQRPRLAAFVAGSTPQTITFDQPLDTKVGEPVTLSASAAPGLQVSFTSNTPAVCTSQHPSVIVLVDGLQVAAIRLGLSVVMRVNAITAGIGGGRHVALHSGRCDITATLAVQGINVLNRQAHLPLPGIIPLSPGIGLLAAGD